MLFQRCFANVETTSINVRRLNFHFQLNINVETTLMNNNNDNNNDFIYSLIKTVITKNDPIKNIYTISNSCKICITKMCIKKK